MAFRVHQDLGAWEIPAHLIDAFRLVFFMHITSAVINFDLFVDPICLKKIDDVFPHQPVGQKINFIVFNALNDFVHVG